MKYVINYIFKSIEKIHLATISKKTWKLHLETSSDQ